jgi:hypothetical protein
MGDPVTGRRTQWVAGVVVAIMVGVVGAVFGSWFGSTHGPVVSTEEAAAVARAAVGDVRLQMPAERANAARPVAFHGDVVDAGYVMFTYAADFGDRWRAVADDVATRLRVAGWTVRTHRIFLLLDDPPYIEVSATHGTTAVQVDVGEGFSLWVKVTNTVPARLMPLTLLGGLVGLAVGSLLGAAPIARRLNRADRPYRYFGLLFGVVALAGLTPGVMWGLTTAIPSWLIDPRFATPFWVGPAESLSNGDVFTLVLVSGLIGVTVTLWRARPQTHVDTRASPAPS